MRLFIALRMPPKVSKILARFQDEFRHDLRGSFPKDFHCTLKFIGETDNAERIKHAMDLIEFDRIKTGLKALSTFGSPPKVLHVTLKPDRIKKVFDDLEKALPLPKDTRDLVPHVTLARIKDIIDYGSFKNHISLALPGLDFDVDRIVLFKSTLTPDGPVYEEIHSRNARQPEKELQKDYVLPRIGA